MTADSSVGTSSTRVGGRQSRVTATRVQRPAPTGRRASRTRRRIRAGTACHRSDRDPRTLERWSCIATWEPCLMEGYRRPRRSPRPHPQEDGSRERDRGGDVAARTLGAQQSRHPSGLGEEGMTESAAEKALDGLVAKGRWVTRTKEPKMNINKRAVERQRPFGRARWWYRLADEIVPVDDEGPGSLVRSWLER